MEARYTPEKSLSNKNERYKELYNNPKRCVIDRTQNMNNPIPPTPPPPPPQPPVKHSQLTDQLGCLKLVFRALNGEVIWQQSII